MFFSHSLLLITKFFFPIQENLPVKMSRIFAKWNFLLVTFHPTHFQVDMVMHTSDGFLVFSSE